MKYVIRETVNVITADRVAHYARAPSIAYLRGAEAALQSDPPDTGVALQLLRQALATLDPK